MGNRESKTLYYTLAATFVVLIALAFTGGKKAGSAFSFFGFGNSSTSRTDFIKIPAQKYKASRFGHDQETAEKTYKNDYRPSSTYARAYIDDQQNQANAPLIASAKFIRKQDKLKKAKKKTNKLLAKNKKKKAGTAATAGDDDEDDFFSDEEDVTANSASSGAGIAANTSGANTQQNANKAKDEENSMNSVEYWERPIFIEEDLKAVVKLIESYQVRKVSNNVFYTLVDDMTHDERPNLREYGLMALSATPSAKSFSELAWMKHNDTTTDLRSNAGKELGNYTNASRVNYVVSALRTSTDSTPKATLEALSALTETSKKYSSLREQSTGTQVDLTNINLLEPRLGTALQVIQEKYSNSADPKIKSEADKTVAAINDFITL